MANEPLTDSLAAFFGGRTIGFDRRWYWRGRGYDEGWADVSDTDLRDLYRLIGYHLRMANDE